jgi:hypothetical protein
MTSADRGSDMRGVRASFLPPLVGRRCQLLVAAGAPDVRRRVWTPPGVVCRASSYRAARVPSGVGKVPDVGGSVGAFGTSPRIP